MALWEVNSAWWHLICMCDSALWFAKADDSAHLCACCLLGIRTPFCVFLSTCWNDGSEDVYFTSISSWSLEFQSGALLGSTCIILCIGISINQQIKATFQQGLLLPLWCWQSCQHLICVFVSDVFSLLFVQACWWLQSYQDVWPNASGRACADMSIQQAECTTGSGGIWPKYHVTFLRMPYLFKLAVIKLHTSPLEFLTTSRIVKTWGSTITKLDLFPVVSSTVCPNALSCLWLWI